MRFIERNGKLTIAKSSQKGMPLSIIENLPEIQTNLTYNYSTKLQQFLWGKELLMDEIPFSFPNIKEHFENGYIGFGYGIENVIKRDVIVVQMMTLLCLVLFYVQDAGKCAPTAGSA
ncbi:hypothetical protein ABET51_04345 [Metabacillus fastidiosus]|uniref:hypothetical protein n=1 Tax=Metabacillus fastidiosus TaxID=1458 RepID=UPI003D2B09C9